MTLLSPLVAALLLTATPDSVGAAASAAPAAGSRGDSTEATTNRNPNPNPSLPPRHPTAATPLGLGLELQLGARVLNDSRGGYQGHLSPGGNVTWEVGRLVGFRGLLLEASYFYAHGSYGTNAVEIGASYHQLALAPMVGIPAGNLLFYAKAGPALQLQTTSWQVKGTTSDWSGTRFGLLGGLGVRALVPFGDLAASFRMEAVGARRDGFNDLFVTSGVGVAY